MMLRVLVVTKVRTRFSLTREVQQWGRRHRFLPAHAWRGDWSGDGLRVSVDELVPLLVWTKEKYQRELRRRGRVPVQERGRGMVCTHRISRFLSTAMANSGE
jgi:hypothetical protein